MKKFSLAVCSLLVSISLTACGQQLEKLPESVKDNNTISNEVIESEDDSVISNDIPEVEEISSTEEDEEVKEDCTFTKESVSKVKKYFKGYNYINIIQSLENGIKDSVNYTEIIYNVIADTNTKVADLDIITSYTDEEASERGDGGVHYIRDFANEITYERNEDDTAWIQSEGKTLMVDWNLNDYKDVYDIWKYLMKDNDTPIGTVGYTSGEYEYYSVITEANKDMLSGIEYDKLGNQEITYIYHKINDDILIPSSVVVEINYFIGETEYYVRNTIQLGSVGDNELLMPELEVE